MTNEYILKEKSGNKKQKSPKKMTINNILQFSKSYENLKPGKEFLSVQLN